jgi:hypothetical protein
MGRFKARGFPGNYRKQWSYAPDDRSLRFTVYHQDACVEAMFATIEWL